MTWSDHVFPHGPITELFPDLFMVTGTLGRSPLPRNMVVARLPSGGLWIHSAIALDDDGMRQLEGLGSPEILIVPSALHRADAGVYKDRYPALRVLCPRATIDAVSTVVNVDGACEDGMPDSGIAVHEVPGIQGAEVVFEVPVGPDRHALVLNDLLFNLAHQPGAAGWVLKHITASTGGLKCTRLARWVLRWDMAQIKPFLLERATAPGLSALTVAHGDCINENVGERLASAANSL